LAVALSLPDFQLQPGNIQKVVAARAVTIALVYAENIAAFLLRTQKFARVRKRPLSPQ
jgi:hypothetical protein